LPAATAALFFTSIRVIDAAHALKACFLPATP
jgi:hypothetical protein